MAVDPQFEAVKKWLSESGRVSRTGHGIRLAIDWVIDGARTRRYSIDQLQPSEKTYIGNRIEHELLHQWALVKEGDLDCIIEGLCVDVKFSLAPVSKRNRDNGGSGEPLKIEGRKPPLRRGFVELSNAPRVQCSVVDNLLKEAKRARRTY